MCWDCRDYRPGPNLVHQCPIDPEPVMCKHCDEQLMDGGYSYVDENGELNEDWLHEYTLLHLCDPSNPRRSTIALPSDRDCDCINGRH